MFRLIDGIQNREVSYKEVWETAHAIRELNLLPTRGTVEPSLGH